MYLSLTWIGQLDLSFTLPTRFHVYTNAIFLFNSILILNNYRKLALLSHRALPLMEQTFSLTEGVIKDKVPRPLRDNVYGSVVSLKFSIRNQELVI